MRHPGILNGCRRERTVRIKWQPDGDRLRTMAWTKRGTSWPGVGEKTASCNSLPIVQPRYSSVLAVNFNAVYTPSHILRAVNCPSGRITFVSYLSISLSLSILCLSATISRQQFVSSLISLSFLFPFISFFLFLFIFNEHRNLRDWDRTNLSRLSISFEMFDLLETKLYRRSLPSAHRPDETAARNVI